MIQFSALRVRELRVLQSRRRPAILAQETHNQHVAAKEDRLGTRNASTHESREIPHLLLCPESHHFAGIVFAVALAEAKLSRDVAVTVFKDLRDW